MRYSVTIEEHVSATVDIDADSEEEALASVEQMYRSGKVVLEPGTVTAVLAQVNESDWIQIV